MREEIENYIKPFYSNFHLIEKKLVFGQKGFEGYIWVMEAPTFKLGEARYYPISYKGILIKTELIDYNNNSVAIGWNATCTSNSSIAIGNSFIAIGTSAVYYPVRIGSYTPFV